MPRQNLRSRAFRALRSVASPEVKRVVRRVGGRGLVAFERRSLRPELSVVMPVFNVAEYLPAALDSVLSQTLHNLEVIAVDDGSTDQSLQILRDYERRDPRVRVLTQVNSGQGLARNAGVALATADFLTFVDSDDTVPPTAFAHMVESLRQSGSDFSVGGVCRFRHNEYIRHVWARTVHASDRIGITLEDYPNAMQDIIACNRMFRTDFWRTRVGGFRGHIAYEDHVPMLTAYVRAKKFDILSAVTYNWRIRENLTSTGQQKARLENLLDRIAVKEEAHQLLKAEASDFVRELWVGRTIEVDFPPFISHALVGDDLYRNILSAVYRTFNARATERSMSYVRVFQKVRGELVAQERWDDVAAADSYFESVHQMPPAHVERGLVVADLPDAPFTAGLPERVRQWSSLESHFEGVLEHLEWTASHLQLTGWAFRRGVPTGSEPAAVRLWLCDRHGARIEVACTPARLPEANIWLNQPYANGDFGGFVARIPRADIAAAGTGRRHFEVEITYAGLTSSGLILNRVRESAALRASSGTLPGGLEATARWDAAHGLTVVVREPAVVVHSLRIDASRGLATGELLASQAPLAGTQVELRSTGGSHRRARITDSEGRIRFEVAIPAVSGQNHAERRFALVVTRRNGPQERVVWRETTPVGPIQSAGAGWQRTQTNHVELVVGIPEVAVDDVALVGETVQLRVLRPGLDHAGVETLTLANSRDSLRLLEARHEGDVSTLTYSLRGRRFGREVLLPSAEYHPSLDVAGESFPVPVSREYGGRMPQRLYSDVVDLKVGQDEEGLAHFYISPPLRDDEVGTFNERRLRDSYRHDSHPPTNSIFFQSYRGEFACDNQLALDHGLRKAKPDWIRYWGVQDRSTEVPEGAIPVIMGSREWYAALASARFISSNIDFGSWFRLRPEQQYLQTFHGYPFKSMGLGFWRSKGLSDEEIARALERVNREWDTILVPSPEASKMYAEQYNWTGKTLVAGYPRTDFLINADPTQVRSRVLGTLGVPEEATVVLYAPTYRDRLTTRAYAAARFDALDLAELSRRLGKDYVVLVRGHNNNQRELDRIQGMDRVIDVTDWPDINELTLAADVAVLDYSSLRFDWALTRKPMIFFVPDRQRYFALRQPLFSFEDSAPGPWLDTTDQVAAALADLPALTARHGAEIDAFNQRYNVLQDGHATERVIRHFFDEPEGASQVPE